MVVEYLRGELAEVLVDLRLLLDPLNRLLLRHGPYGPAYFLLPLRLSQTSLIIRVLPAAKNAPQYIDGNPHAYTHRSKDLEGPYGRAQVAPDAEGYAGDNKQHGEPKEALSNGAQRRLPQAAHSSPGCEESGGALRHRLGLLGSHPHGATGEVMLRAA